MSSIYAARQWARQWLLAVDSTSVPVRLSWANEVLPHGVPLRLWEVAQPNTDATPLPGTTIALDATRELEIAAPATRYFVIGTTYAYELRLRLGWNMFSLPLEPTEPAVTAVFAGTGVYTNAIWAWDSHATPPNYVVATAIHALTGYFAYAPSPIIVTVYGTSPEATEWQLDDGWNMVGTPIETNAPSAPLVVSPAWRWDGALYSRALRLYPGLGYWLFSPLGGTWVFNR